MKNTHITFFHHINLNKTLKTNKNLVRTSSMSKKKNKEQHHYLMETASSLNKKTNKYENTVHKPVDSNSTMSQKSILQHSISRQQRPVSHTSASSFKSSINQYNSQKRQSFLKKAYNWDSNNNEFCDKLNHFEVNTDFGHDPFGHFS